MLRQKIVAKKMKSHTIGETIVLPAFPEMVKIIFGMDVVSDLNKISISDNTTIRRKANMSSNIERNVLSKIKNLETFALQVDESTDISCKAHVLAFVRFIDNGAIVEDFLCCKKLPETTKKQHIYDAFEFRICI